MNVIEKGLKPSVGRLKEKDKFFVVVSVFQGLSQGRFA
jgi:hypothetical protein